MRINIPKRLLYFFSVAILACLLMTIFTPDVEAYEITMRVLILRNQAAVNITSSQPLNIKNAHTLNEMSRGMKKYVLKANNGKVVVNDKTTVTSHIYIAADDYHTPLNLNGVPYRGYYMVGVNEQGNLMVVNHVGLDDYLAGVLGGEIIASWPIEAIKAQAVAARTYALHRARIKQTALFDVTNDTSDQMYIGVRGESPSFNRAVRETRSQVLGLNGELICAYYHSNCGGATSDSDAVFKTGDRSFKGTKDPFCAGAPNSTWNYRVSSDEITQALKKANPSIGKILSIKPLAQDGAGRILTLEIEHEGGTLELPGTEFRRLLGYGNLKSTRFRIQDLNLYTYQMTKRIATSRMKKVGDTWVNETPAATSSVQQPASRQVPAVYNFTGAGWGHGVGLCQWGARGKALKNYDYRSILAHYYPNTTIYVVNSKNE